MVFCGGVPEIHCAGCTSGSCTQHQEGKCSTWQSMGPHFYVEDNKQVLNGPMARAGRRDYVGLSVADQELIRIISEDR